MEQVFEVAMNAILGVALAKYIVHNFTVLLLSVNL